MRNLRLPGTRDVRATRDGDGDANAVVVACPPHPQFAGDRHDGRLRAVSDALGERGIDCLRFDYGKWDEGRGEQTDARTALEWAAGKYDVVGLFGYSFGAAIALLVAGDADSESVPAAVSALAPAASVVEDDDVVGALEAISCPTQVIYGERDDVADWQPVADRARELDVTVEAVPADHFFVGQHAKVGTIAATFLAAALQE